MLTKSLILFLHPPKTAGTSIENALLNKKQKKYFPKKHDCFAKLEKHSTYHSYLNVLDSKPKITFMSIRNPYERHFSYFKNHINGKRIKYNPEMTMYERFNDYMYNLYQKTCDEKIMPLKVEENLYLKYCSGDYSILDYIIVFENINEDWKQFQDFLKKSRNNISLPNLDHLNKSRKLKKTNFNYKDVYSSISIEIFNEKNKKDIEFYNKTIKLKNNLSKNQKNKLLINY